MLRYCLSVVFKYKWTSHIYSVRHAPMFFTCRYLVVFLTDTEVALVVSRRTVLKSLFFLMIFAFDYYRNARLLAVDLCWNYLAEVYTTIVNWSSLP